MARSSKVYTYATLPFIASHKVMQCPPIPSHPIPLVPNTDLPLSSSSLSLAFVVPGTGVGTRRSRAQVAGLRRRLQWQQSEARADQKETAVATVRGKS